MSATTPPETLTIAEAMRLAAAHGLSASLVVQVAPSEREFLVTVVTSDPKPVLSVREIGRGPERDMLLSAREQSGPDRWDYPARIAVPHERLAVELSLGESSVAVPCHSAALSILAHHGWPSDGIMPSGKSAPVRIDATAFRDAVTRLGQVPISE